MGKIESTREKILLGFHQQFKLGEVARLPSKSQAESSVLVQDPDTDSSRPAFGHLGNLMSQEISNSDHDGEDEDLNGNGDDDDDDEDNDDDDDDDDDLEGDIYSDYDDQFIYDSEYSDYSL